MTLANSMSGLIAAAKAIDVVGNNIANSQTIGFKSSIARFTSVTAVGNASGPTAKGGAAGVSADNIFQQFTQGDVALSNNPLDMAINGLGFFRLFDAENNRITYTRDGQFRLSYEGDSFPKLVTRSGLNLTGNLPDFSTDPYGTIDATPAPVPISVDPYFPPKPSSAVQLNLNLDSRVAAPAIAFNPANPLSYNTSTMATVFDAVGESHDLRMYLAKPAAASAWNVYTTLDFNANATPPMVPVVTGPLALNFDTQGVLTTTMPMPPITLPTANGNLQVSLDFGGTTQVGTSFSINAVTQDGYGEGKIQEASEFAVLADGHISARYSNGQRRNVAQIVLANFTNPNSLVNLGDNQWTTNDDPVRGTGTVTLGFPNFSTLKGNASVGNSDPAEGMGSLQGYAIEQSNVDLSVELVSLIEQQRNYQASAQTFKILDQVLQNLANMRSG
jgi:flagellar hook protein FlgE